jgi:hypothetical protein
MEIWERVPDAFTSRRGRYPVLEQTRWTINHEGSIHLLSFLPHAESETLLAFAVAVCL